MPVWTIGEQLRGGQFCRFPAPIAKRASATPHVDFRAKIEDKNLSTHLSECIYYRMPQILHALKTPVGVPIRVGTANDAIASSQTPTSRRQSDRPDFWSSSRLRNVRRRRNQTGLKMKIQKSYKEGSQTL